MRGKELVYLLYKSGATDCVYMSRSEILKFMECYKGGKPYLHDSFTEPNRLPFGINTGDLSGWKVADGATEFYTKKLEFPKEYINAFPDRLAKVQEVRGNDKQRVEGIPASPPFVAEEQIEVADKDTSSEQEVKETITQAKDGSTIEEHWVDGMKFVGKNWDNTEANLFKVECKCGQMYYRRYFYNATKEGCPYCGEIVFTDRKLGRSMIGRGKYMGVGQLMTNRYFVDRERK